jgi:hypothetical protein
VNEHVAFDAAQRRYHYEIWYNDGRDSEDGGDHLLLDPEIVVEGGPDPTPIDHDDQVGGRPKTPRRPRKPAGNAGKRKQAAARQGIKRKAARKPAVRKARKGGKAKPATRKPAKRKAKKR